MSLFSTRYCDAPRSRTASPWRSNSLPAPSTGSIMKLVGTASKQTLLKLAPALQAGSGMKIA
jgi:hypothetical protein